MLDQARAAHALAGESWRAGGDAATFAWGGDAGAACATLLDALARSRMRAVALCRLCFGTAAAPTVRAPGGTAIAFEKSLQRVSDTSRLPGF